MNAMSASVAAAWYVIHTKPRQEFRALEHLRNQHYECFLPTIQVKKLRGRKLDMEEEALFSRYLFIRLDRETSNWSALRSTRGVSCVVAFGSRYATLPDSWIDALRTAMPSVQQTLFAPGDCVSIASGPLAGFEGIYHAPDGNARALVLVELMSQPQKLRVSLEMLRKAA